MRLSSMKKPNIWLISDTHFNHAKLVTMGKGRPENFESLIMNGLRSVKEGDTLIHLGDFCIGKDEYWHDRFSKALVGVNKVLVRGNHDNKSYNWYLSHGWNHVCEIMQSRYFGKEILFSHMPILKKEFWETYHEPELNIHGHLHGNANRHGAVYDPKFHYDVAPDIHDYEPILLERLLANQMQRDITNQLNQK